MAINFGWVTIINVSLGLKIIYCEIFIELTGGVFRYLRWVVGLMGVKAHAGLC